jgi:hypothetical protein
MGPTVTDLSGLSSSGVKETNETFFNRVDQDYGNVLGGSEETKQKIWNVKGTRLYRVFREFPRDEGLIAQCAHWMRSFVGLHFFPDANHRTGMALLQALLKDNGVDDAALPGRHIDRAVIRSKLIRLLQLDSVTLRDLWKRDELYVHWCRYFRDSFYDTRNEHNSDCSMKRLQHSLNAARKRTF